MTLPGEPPHSNEAEGAFADFLSRRDAGEEIEFEAFCRAHPSCEAELQRMYADYNAIVSRFGRMSERPSVAERIKRHFGKNLDPGISLDPELARDIGDSAASSKLFQQLRARAPAQTRYEVRGEIARGGMGAILRVSDADLRRSLAMKVMLADSSDPERDKRCVRFLEEAQITGQLDHPAVVPVHELGVDHDGRLFFTMRLVRGHDFKEVLKLVREGKDGWNQTRALHVLLKVCEAVAYAHSKGVIHRDLKPSNIMVGRFGETYVMDWGLAKVVGREDSHDLRLATDAATKTHIVGTERRDASSNDPDSPLVTIDGEVFGTPSYMAPEQANGLVHEVGLHSDVYSLGAILYHLLAGEMPYVSPGARISSQVVLGMVIQGPPRPVPEIDPHVPAELVAICEKAMARDPAQRYADTLAMSEDLRAYLENRVVRAHRTGAMIEFKKWVLRNKGTASALAACLVLAIGGLGSTTFVQAKGRYEVQQKHEEIIRLADIKRFDDYRAEADLLWPPYPALLERFDAWLRKAEDLLGRREVHARRLALLDGATSRASTTEEQWERESLRGLVRGLDAFIDPDPRIGTVASVKWRREFASTIEARSIGDHRREWGEAIDAIARSPRYGGLHLQPQLGLVPLACDPQSGLWEFWVVQSGDRPVLDPANGGWVITGDTGIVLVLLPAGSFTMGAVRPEHDGDAEGPNRDPRARRDEAPLHAITLRPFFLSKYETTQGQWLRVTGRNPSFYQPGAAFSESVTLSHPVESVQWEECRSVLGRLGLELPTEAQWEYAARAGTSTVWWTGNDRGSLAGAANVADRAATRAGFDWPAILDWPDFDDGNAVHAAAGSYRPNRFGLHEMIGNVWEWCRDFYGSYELPVRPGDGERQVLQGVNHVMRSGSFYYHCVDARSAARYGAGPGDRGDNLGVRAGRRVDGLDRTGD